MPKAQTLLPPALDPAEEMALESQSLEGVGVHAVLGAMIQQRRASQVAAEELLGEGEGEDDLDAPPSSDERRAPRPPRSKRDPASSDVFLKAR